MVPAGTSPADYSTAETDKTVIMQWIMNERLIELAGEGQRWFDIRDGPNKESSHSIMHFSVRFKRYRSAKAYLFPYP
jgi:hypothetical protein